MEFQTSSFLNKTMTLTGYFLVVSALFVIPYFVAEYVPLIIEIIIINMIILLGVILIHYAAHSKTA